MAVAALLASQVGCSPASGASATIDLGTGPESSGEISVALTLPGGSVLDEVSWVVAGPNDASTVVARGSVGLQSSAAIAFQVAEIPAGSDYQVSITGTSADGSVTCSGSAPFAVTAGATTPVSVLVQCNPPTPSTGSAAVAASTFNCAIVGGIDASPLETAVGAAISLVGHATGADPTQLTYAWSAPSGTFSTPTSAETDFTCAAPGPVTLTLTVADGPVPDGGTCSQDIATIVVGCGTTIDAGSVGGCPSASPTGSTAVAYQITPTHDGAQPGDSIAGLCRRWSWTPAAGAAVSYALVAAGRVFVTYMVNGSPALIALDEHTGARLWGPAPLSSSFGRANAAYDSGAVFTVTGSGSVSAFDEATGNLNWTTQLGQTLFSSPPTARGGAVYVGGAGSGGTLYALAESSGAVTWSAPVMNGDQSSPAVTTSAVFVSYACDQAYSFSLSGGLLWHHDGPCEGGGGKTVTVLGGNVYARDFEGNLILDSATGNTIGSFAATPIPAASGSTGYFVTGGQLFAIPLGQGAATWTFAGDGSMASAPIVVGDKVVGGSSKGKLYLLDAATGSVISSDTLPAPIAVPDEQNVGAPLAALAAADGMLFVPAGDTLYAY